MEITRGRIPCGQKVIIYGVPGIGKSTLAAQFPNAVFIDTEGSTRNFDVARFPAPSSWEMLKSEVQYAIDHPGDWERWSLTRRTGRRNSAILR